MTVLQQHQPHLGLHPHAIKGGAVGTHHRLRHFAADFAAVSGLQLEEKMSGDGEVSIEVRSEVQEACGLVNMVGGFAQCAPPPP